MAREQNGDSFLSHFVNRAVVAGAQAPEMRVLQRLTPFREFFEFLQFFLEFGFCLAVEPFEFFCRLWVKEYLHSDFAQGHEFFGTRFGFLAPLEKHFVEFPCFLAFLVKIYD